MESLKEIYESLGLLMTILLSIPTVGPVLYSLFGKLGKAGIIFTGLWVDLKDGKLDDKEIALRVWMLVAVLSGPWPNCKSKILRAAPSHQIKELEKIGFKVK